MCIPEFGDFLNKEVTQCQDDLMEVFNKQDKTEILNVQFMITPSLNT